MARFHGFSPQTPYDAVVGPGVAVANLNETLLATATVMDDATINSIINSGDVLGATDDGLDLSFPTPPNGRSGNSRVSQAMSGAGGALLPLR